MQLSPMEETYRVSTPIVHTDLREEVWVRERHRQMQSCMMDMPDYSMNNSWREVPAELAAVNLLKI